MNKIPCSVSLLTLNSAKTLERCLFSLVDFDEIIMLDGNSTDGTREIATRFPNVKIFAQTDTAEQNVRIKNFSEMKLKSYHLTSHDWVFWIDSDNYLPPATVEKIRTLVQADNKNEAYAFPRLAVIAGRIILHAPMYPAYALCLSNKQSGVTWPKEKLVHEHLVVPPGVAAVRYDEPIYSVWPEFEQFKSKNDWYLDLAMQKFLSSPEKLSVGSYARFLFRNTLRAVKLFLKTIWQKILYGAKDTLPWNYSMVFVIYHLKLVWNKRKIMTLIKKYSSNY